MPSAAVESAKIQAPTEPNASKGKDDSGLSEIRKLKPPNFKEGGDLPTFLEKFTTWAKAGQLKHKNLHTVLLAMIDDTTTYQQLKKLTLTLRKSRMLKC